VEPVRLQNENGSESAYLANSDPSIRFPTSPHRIFILSGDIPVVPHSMRSLGPKAFHHFNSMTGISVSPALISTVTSVVAALAYLAGKSLGLVATVSFWITISW
jgi:hypothetical protein